MSLERGGRQEESREEGNKVVRALDTGVQKNNIFQDFYVQILSFKLILNITFIPGPGPGPGSGPGLGQSQI